MSRSITNRELPAKRKRKASAPSAADRPAKAPKRRHAAERKISRTRKPDDMSLEEWQVALRRQFGRQQKFKLKNQGSEPVFSDFEVFNPQTKRAYRVAIRGQGVGDNFCSCPDFAVNTLGTCKHVEFTLGKLETRPGGKKTLARGFEPEYSEVYLRYGAKREVAFRPGRNCPAALRRLAKPYFDGDNRLRPDGFARFPQFLAKARTLESDFHCYADALAFITQVRDRTDLAGRVDRAFPSGVRGPAWKKLLKVSLYPYQREGALFAAKAGRCLLADDMGLGKTIQAIAAAEILAALAGVERVLVIAPTSLKHQWRQEIEKFTGRQALVVEGLIHRRRELYAADSFFKLTNYDVVHRDLNAIRDWQPDLIILDEAQRIKNWKTRAAQSVKQLDSPYAIVLTGTPLENRLEELHSIVEFIDRWRLGPMFRFLAEHQQTDESGRVVGYRNLSKISETLAPILVRRHKNTVLKQLPERLEKRFFVPMTEPQAEYHQENAQTVARIIAKWRHYRFLSEADQLRMRVALQNMRMSCNSTYLLDKTTDFGVKADEMVRLLEEMFEDRDTKVVVFSQWVRMHELVVRRLKQRKWNHVLFHGGVPGPARRHLVDRFKEDATCRLFLSTDAGGVGLNLQHASAVINLDQPWNPAVLEQRIGRVHRLGQHRPVQVVHYIAQGTIEEGMLNLLAFKRSMFAGVLDGGEDEVFMGKTRLRQFMDSVEKATGAIPPAMPHAAESPIADGDGDGDGAAEAPSTTEQAEVASRGAPTDPAQQIWSDVFAAGQSLLEKIGQAVLATEDRGSTSGRFSIPDTLLARDESSGQPFLRLPLPDPATLKKAIDLFSGLFGKR